MQIVIDDFKLDAPSLSRVMANLDELLREEEDHADSMTNGHGHALATAIKCVEELRQAILDATGWPPVLR